MRTITVIAIVAAAAAGIIAAAVLNFYPVTRTTSPPIIEQQETVMGGANASNNGYRQVNVTINDVELVADIAATNDQRSKGLAVKDTLAENEAMLFVFSDEREHVFWMKDMKFPIDIIWLDDDGEVVHVEHSLEPCAPDSFCPRYEPDEDALYVLETVAGFAMKHNVTESSVALFDLE